MSELTLRLPYDYVEIGREEMEYVDGGWYISHSTCMAIDFAIGASMVGSAAQLAALVSGAAAYVGTLLAASIPIAGWIAGAALTACILNQATSIGSALFTDMVRGKGIDVSLGWFWCTPYLSFSPR